MGFQRAIDGARCHLVKFVLGFFILGVLSLLSPKAFGSSLTNDMSCLTERALPTEQFHTYLSVRNDFAQLIPYRKYVGTTEASKYYTAYRPILARNQKYFNDPVLVDYMFYLTNEEEFKVLVGLVLGLNSTYMQDVEHEMRSMVNGVGVVTRGYKRKMAALQNAVEQRLQELRAEPSTPYNRYVLDRSRQITSSINTINEFWARETARRRETLRDYNAANSNIVKGTISTAVTVYTTWRALLLMTRFEAIAPNFGSVMFACVNGAVGLLSSDGMIEAFRNYWEAKATLADKQRALKDILEAKGYTGESRKKLVNTTYSCEIRRIMEEKAKEQWKQYASEVSSGAAVGCLAGAAARVAPSKTAKAFAGTGGLAIAYHTGKWIVAMQNAGDKRAAAESLEALKKAGVLAGQGREEEAREMFYEAERIAVEGRVHFLQAVYMSAVAVTLGREVIHTIKAGHDLIKSAQALTAASSDVIPATANAMYGLWLVGTKQGWLPPMPQLPNISYEEILRNIVDLWIGEQQHAGVIEPEQTSSAP